MGYLFGKPPAVIPLGEAGANDVPPARHYLMQITSLNLYPSMQKVSHGRRNSAARTPGSDAAAANLFTGDFGDIAKPGWSGLRSNFDLDFKGAFTSPGPTLVLIWLRAPHFQFADGTDRAITAASELAASRMYEPRIFSVGNRRRIASFIVRPKPAGVSGDEYLDFNICVTAPGGPGSDPIDVFIDPKVRNDG
ncbi:hypothetical protein [Sandarakinorhabdus sp.]|uniref:hypothetical protein n=1 Tax=Sandarakinorhabdus sp. TaxID=1916663 RepID=UPI0028AC159C|nr:hypothetical protein [Sandarakinorhabdus sp.]